MEKHKQRISFEVAKLAKEKGYKQTGYWFYLENDKVCRTEHEPFKAEGFAAPTQTKMMSWLRHTHNLHITTFPLIATEGIYYRVYISRPIFPRPNGYNSVPWNPAQVTDSTLRLSDYEDTINMALLAALNLL